MQFEKEFFKKAIVEQIAFLKRFNNKACQDLAKKLEEQIGIYYSKKENRCSNCRFRDFYIGACACENSDRYGDYSFMNDVCDKWELIGSK
jgi:type IV secretory pathway VirB4 component